MEPLQYEERGYLKESFRLFHLADGRGEYIEYHYHAFHKIIILLAGKAGYAVEGERYELSPGDFVLVGRGSIHRPVVAAGDYYERMILYIAPEYLRSLTAGDCDPSECFRRAQETFQYVYRDENGSRVRPLFQALAETIRQGGYGAALLAQAQFTELMVEVNRVVRGGHRVGAAGGDSKVISLLQYLNLHLTEPLTIDQLAERFYISKYHMMRRFRQETGYSVHGYLTEKRLLLAQQLLARGCTPAEAAVHLFHFFICLLSFLSASFCVLIECVDTICKKDQSTDECKHTEEKNSCGITGFNGLGCLNNLILGDGFAG